MERDQTRTAKLSVSEGSIRVVAEIRYVRSTRGAVHERD
jgi:hypothetical protein